MITKALVSRSRISARSCWVGWLFFIGFWFGIDGHDAQAQPASGAKTSAQETKSDGAKKPGLPKGFVPPKLKEFIQAPYPKEVKEKREVSVILQLIVDKKGKVAKATILQSGGEAFDKAAQEAAKQFEFEPATYKGKPVPVRINYRYRFFFKATKASDSSDKAAPSGKENKATDTREKPRKRDVLERREPPPARGETPTKATTEKRTSPPPSRREKAQPEPRRTEPAMRREPSPPSSKTNESTKTTKPSERATPKAHKKAPAARRDVPAPRRAEPPSRRTSPTPPRTRNETSQGSPKTTLSKPETPNTKSSKRTQSTPGGKDGADGQGVFLQGTVTQRGTRKPIDGATIYVIGRRKRLERIADEQGRYAIEKLPPGRYRIVIPVPNFQKFQTVIQVFSGARRRVKLRVDPKTKKKPTPVFLGEKQRLNFYLVGVGSGLFETVTREKKEKREILRQSIRREEIRMMPGTEGDPLKVVQNLPGVARTPLNTGFFIVRGSAPEDSRVYLNGHQIPQLYHFGGLTAVVNGEMAERLDFIAGGFSVAYGRSLGGVIDLKLRRGKDRWQGFVDLDLIDVGFFLEGPLWKGANLIVSARRSHLDAVLNVALPNIRAFDLTVAPRYYDFQVKLDWRLSKRNQLTFLFYGSDDRLSFLRDIPVGRSGIRGEFSFGTAFYRLNGGWLLREAKFLEHELSYDVGITLTDSTGGEQLELTSSNFVISVRDELRLKFSPSLKMRVGADVQIRRVDLAIRFPIPRASLEDSSTSRTIETNRWVGDPGVYAELDWKIVPSLRAIAGVRFDYYSDAEEFTVDPRLNFAWSLAKWMTIKGSVGLFSQPPSGTDVSEGFGNPDVKPERAIHYTLGFNNTWKCPPGMNEICREVTTRVTFYYKDMFDLIVGSDRVVERDGEEVEERRSNDGVGRAYGLEVLVRLPPHRRFFGWISYTLGRSERQNRNGEWELFGFDQTHILTMLAAYKIGWGFSISARLQVVSGNPSTPFTGSIYDADTGGYTGLPGKVNSKRNPLFHQLDLRLDYEIVFPVWKLQFYLDLRNVYNNPNQEGTINNYDFSKTAPLTGIPILPSFGVRGQF